MAGERWLAGLRSEGIRELHAGELSELRSLRQRWQRRFWIGLTLAIVPGPAAILIIAIANNSQFRGASVVTLLFAIVALPLGILTARDARKALRRASTLLESGRVETFVQPQGTYALGEEPARTEIEPASGVIYRAFERVDLLAPALNPAEVSANPQTVTGEFPRQFVPAAWSESGLIRVREMTGEERAELSRLVAGGPRFPWLGLGFTLWGMVGIASLVEGRMEPFQMLMFCLIVFSAGAHWYRFVSEERLRRRMRCDYDGGVLHAFESIKHGRSEFLPISGVFWTVNDSPSTFRTSGSLK